MAFSEGQKSGHKNVDGHKNLGHKNLDGLYVENKLKPEMAHETGSRQNFAKICGPKFFLENSDQADKFSEVSIFENSKFREISAGIVRL